MGIKSFNPYTPSRRHMTVVDRTELSTAAPEKSLTVSLKKNAGRNAQGKITVRHRGGGSKRKYRIIDFKRNKDGVPATVKSIEYDPNRTANIALIAYADGQKAYILAPEGLKVGQKVMETVSHLRIFRLVHRFTTSSLCLVRVDSLYVQQETVHSLWLKKESMQRSDFLQAK